MFYGFVSGMDVLGIRQFIFALEIQLALTFFFGKASALLRRAHVFSTVYFLSNLRSLQMIPPFKFESF